MDAKVRPLAQRAFRDRDRERNRRGQDDLRSGGARLRGADRRARRRGEGLREFRRRSRARPGARARSRAAPRAAARRADRSEGHHRYVRYADRDGLADLSRQPAARGRLLRRAAAPRRRGHPRQDRDLRIRRQRAAGNHQSAQSPRIRRAARRAARRRRSPITWCRRRSARRPAVRCCARRRFAACSATSRPTTPSTSKASGRPPTRSTPSAGWRAPSTTSSF